VLKNNVDCWSGSARGSSGSNSGVAAWAICSPYVRADFSLQHGHWGLAKSNDVWPWSTPIQQYRAPFVTCPTSIRIVVASPKWECWACGEFQTPTNGLNPPTGNAPVPKTTTIALEFSTTVWTGTCSPNACFTPSHSTTYDAEAE